MVVVISVVSGSINRFPTLEEISSIGGICFSVLKVFIDHISWPVTFTATGMLANQRDIYSFSVIALPFYFI